jgi:regulatory protein
MIITAIKRQKGPRTRVNVYVDGELRCTLGIDLAREGGLRVGGSVEPADLARLEATEAVRSARERALRLLESRSRSRKELRTRLVQSGLPAAATDEALDQLQLLGFVDDAAFARAFASERLRRRPKGPAAIIAELRARGIEDEAARAAVAEMLDEEGVDEVELARSALRTFRVKRGETAQARHRRLAAFLGRRGFSGETVRRLIEQAGEQA